MSWVDKAHRRNKVARDVEKVLKDKRFIEASNRREEQAGRRCAALEKRRFRDPEYFKGLYPRSVRRCQSFVEACCDRYDHPGSPIYDEYPDRVLLLGIRNRILEEMREQGEDTDQDLVWILTLQEILRRRAIS